MNNIYVPLVAQDTKSYEQIPGNFVNSAVFLSSKKVPKVVYAF